MKKMMLMILAALAIMTTGCALEVVDAGTVTDTTCTFDHNECVRWDSYGYCRESEPVYKCVEYEYNYYD